MIDALIIPIAAHSQQQPDGPAKAPERIHVMPLGVMQGRDGRGPYELPASDMQQVITASLSQAAGGVIPIDYDHALTRGGGEAAGWMTGLEATPEGIFASVEWTPKGEQAVASKGYRFISPVFRYAKSGGRVLRIEHAALTNLPNLDVQAIASRLGSPKDDGEDDMDLLAELRKEFGLPDTADAAAVAAHAKGMKDKLVAPPASPDPTAFVSMDKFLALGEQLNSLQAQIATAAHTQAVDSAIAQGKAIPAERDALIAIASQNPDQFGKLIAARQALPQTQRMLPNGGAAPAREDGLTDTDLAVASQLGLTADVVAAVRKTEAA